MYPGQGETLIKISDDIREEFLTSMHLGNHFRHTSETQTRYRDTSSGNKT